MKQSFPADQGAGEIPTSPYAPFKGPRDTPGPLAPQRARSLVTRPTETVSGTHFVWHLSRGVYRCKVALP